MLWKEEQRISLWKPSQSFNLNCCNFDLDVADTGDLSLFVTMDGVEKSVNKTNFMVIMPEIWNLY